MAGKAVRHKKNADPPPAEGKIDLSRPVDKVREVLKLREKLEKANPPRSPGSERRIPLPQLRKAQELMERGKALEQANQSQPTGEPRTAKSRAAYTSKENLAPIIQALRKWREDNGMSQQSAAVVMAQRGLAVPVDTIRTWEQGKRTPGRYTEHALWDFFQANPRIDNPPVFKRGPK